jgi:hypothetical protein
VDVALPTGGTETREGTYTIMAGSTPVFTSSFKTGTGVDVPAGTYRVDVTYASNTGPKTFTETVTVP